MNTGVYMNEWERFPANWLRALYPKATVDERSIADVRADELAGHERCHFFAGIGGWEYALQLAGWPAEWPVWTGSCPCQPFSAAGKGLGTADPRHLWPELRRLISECRPPVVFGEQVASRAGREWLAGVRADLEALGYAVGASDLCAAGVGAPHIRQRLYWGGWRLGNADGGGSASRGPAAALVGHRSAALADGGSGGLADSDDGGRRKDGSGGRGSADGRREPVHFGSEAANAGLDVGLGHADEQGPQGRRQQLGEYASERSAWSPSAFILCADGKARRVEPGVCPLAHGVPGRVGQLRGYGNAIVPQVAATFVKAFLEATRHA